MAGSIVKNNSHKQIATIFDSPIVIKGRTWLPFTQLGVWAIMTFVDRRRHSERSFPVQAASGGLCTLVILGSEWCHNLAHAAAAWLVGKPMDQLYIQGGLPRCVYHAINDLTVTPHEHIIRSLGGPLCNVLTLPFWFLFKRATQPDSLPRDVAEAGFTMNTFLSTVSLLPIPGIDGGSILKWLFVSRGKNLRSIPSELCNLEPCTWEAKVQQADALVARVNRFSGAGLAATSAVMFKKKRWLWASICALFALLSWLVGYEVIKEQS